MPDYYPQEKGSIKRDRVGEFIDLMAKNQLDMMPIGGMAAKMSSPAVDVLSRWIRRFRKDKPPTVPAKHIKKALKHEEERSGFGEFGMYENMPTEADKRSSMIMDMMLYGGGDEGIGTEHYLGFKEKEARDGLLRLLQPEEETAIEFLNRIGRRR